MKVKKEELRKWTDLEEKILAQRSKINWLQLEDGNNAYFHAIVKGKNKGACITKLCKIDGSLATTQDEI